MFNSDRPKLSVKGVSSVYVFKKFVHTMLIWKKKLLNHTDEVPYLEMDSYFIEKIVNIQVKLARGGVLPYIGYTGMCHWRGYGFQAIWSGKGYGFQAIWSGREHGFQAIWSGIGYGFKPFGLV